MDIPYGYLYVATGEKHLKECVISVNSLRKHDSKAHITLITDKECSIGSLFDNVIIKTESVEQPYMYKIQGIIATPYPFTLFVDTDTYFCDSCRELLTCCLTMIVVLRLVRMIILMFSTKKGSLSKAIIPTIRVLLLIKIIGR